LTPSCFQVFPIKGLPLVKKEDDLAKLSIMALNQEGLSLQNDDVIVYSAKVVSKAEGRIADIRQITPSKKAIEIGSHLERDSRFVQLVLKESENVCGFYGKSLVVKDKRGMICINAGIDKSNVAGEFTYCLLPKDPFLSAQRLSSRLIDLTRIRRIGVVLVDSSTRPFRRGLSHYTLGYAGIAAFIDYRGKKDLFGYPLRVKVLSVVDEIACAAGICLGESHEGIAAVLFRGLKITTNQEKVESLTVTPSEDIYKSTVQI
jgi:coenzyme F420-0:L-glutamate ligase/coenzyme F420-1:gamma-L-glutamate ligase